MGKYKRHVTLFLLNVVCQYLAAQYNFVQIAKEQGLSHNNVECIIQDNDGFMWFGTRNGLCRFDGYEIKTYRNTSELNSISGNRILSLAEDKNGFLWIGTYQNGLTRYDKHNNLFYRYADVGPQVYSIEVTNDSSVYIGTNNGLFIYSLQKETFVHFVPNDAEHSLNSYLVSDILETHDGEVYIATWENDIQRYDRKTKHFFSVKYIQDGQQVINYRKHLLEDNNGNIWIAARIHGLYRYNRQDNSFAYYGKGENGLNSDVLNGEMMVGEDGKIWITTDGGGINIFDPKTETFEYITNEQGVKGALPSNQVYTLFLDNSNRVWAGTFDKGVAYYDPLMNKFKNSKLPDQVHNFFMDKSIISLFQDSRETVWIGTDGDGLHAIDKYNNLTTYYVDETTTNSISSNVITSLGEDASGNILIGTYTGGLCVYNPGNKKFTQYLPDANNSDAIHSENVWTLLADSKGTNWLGLLGAGADIYYSAPGTFKNIGPYSNELIKIGHPNVMCLLEDADGDIWFGTEGHGIFVYDRQVDKVLRIKASPNSNILTEGVIKDLYLDSRGEVWIATEGNGLFRYNEASKTLAHFTTEEGLPGMIVMGIQEDNAGNIWVSTYDGLALLRNNFDSFISFYKYDGLTSNEFNGEAFIKLRNGTFFIGSVNGLNVFDPLTITFNQNVPKVYFTRLTVLNNEVEPNDTINDKKILDESILHTKEITLDYDDKTFSIEFAALNYTHPQKCQYKYMLDGFDKDWIYTDHDRRFASYSNLPEGNYVFKVQASNNDGKWGNNTTELAINVLPPFWKTFWFIGIMIMLLSGIIILIYYNRVRLLRNRFLQEKVKNERRIVELEKENIETELEKLTYYTVNRNRELINYKNKLNALSVKAKESVKHGLQIVIEEIDKEIANDTEWKYIEPRLDKFYNNFITKLREKHPELTLSEIKVASYVRMNLTSKEISEFMHKTIRAVENDRYRLRKKINLSSNESLQNYLMNL